MIITVSCIPTEGGVALGAAGPSSFAPAPVATQPTQQRHAAATPTQQRPVLPALRPDKYQFPLLGDKVLAKGGMSEVSTCAACVCQPRLGSRTRVSVLCSLDLSE